MNALKLGKTSRIIDENTNPNEIFDDGTTLRGSFLKLADLIKNKKIKAIGADGQKSK